MIKSHMSYSNVFRILTESNVFTDDEAEDLLNDIPDVQITYTLGDVIHSSLTFDHDFDLTAPEINRLIKKYIELRNE